MFDESNCVAADKAILTFLVKANVSFSQTQKHNTAYHNMIRAIKRTSDGYVPPDYNRIQIYISSIYHDPVAGSVKK